MEELMTDRGVFPASCTFPAAVPPSGWSMIRITTGCSISTR